MATGCEDYADGTDEEIVFRIIALCPLFALTYGTNGQVLLFLAALGTALTLLRVRSKGLWLPVGYHWAWNIVQTVVLGAVDTTPSVRPLYVTGPYRWMGWPGHPEPELLSTLIHLVIVLLVWARMRGSRGQRGSAG